MELLYCLYIGVVILSSSRTVKNLIATLMATLFSITLLNAMYHLNRHIIPGVSNIYNALGTKIAPNLVTVVIFDFRAYDTLGESIILLTAGLVVLLIFGRGLLGDKR